VAISANGQVVLVGLSNGDITIYNVADGRLSSTLKGHETSVTGLSFAPDGKAFASYSYFYDPLLWKFNEEFQSAEIASTIDITAAATQEVPGARAVAVLAWLLGKARGFQIVGAPHAMGVPPIFPTYAGKHFRHCGPRIVFSPDGRYLAASGNPSSSFSGGFKLFVTNLSTTQTLTITGMYGCAVAFTKDSKIVITGGLGAPVLWDPETGERVDY